MSQNLRNIFSLPLCSRDLKATVNLFDGRLYCPRTNRTEVFRLVVSIVDNPVAMFFKLLTKVLGLFALQVNKQGNGFINLPMP